MMQITFSNSWLKFLKPEFEKAYMQNLYLFLQNEYSEKKIIYPAAEKYFYALELVDLKKVKVVILGQDPYHGHGQAHGLCFSVPDGVDLPPSLKNIFKELKNDLGIESTKSGNLSRWANQGVLLLNSVLTVEKDKAASHQKKGWEEFTDKVINIVNENCDHVVFILWGAYAQKKASFVNKEKHLILECVHPSPLSAHRGFFGSKPFSKTNQWLATKGLSSIEW